MTTAVPVADLTKADLGKTVSITSDDITITGPLTRIEHEARLVDDLTFADRERALVVTGISTTLAVKEHEFRFPCIPIGGVFETETSATIEVLS